MEKPFQIAYFTAILVSFVSAMTTNLDTTLSQYTKDGTVKQIIYASTAARKGNPVVAWTSKGTNQSIFLALSPKKSRLSAHCPYGCIRIIDDGTVAAFTGYAPDCRRVLKELMVIHHSNLLTYGEKPSMYLLNSALSTFITRGLFSQDEKDSQSSSISRPLAVDLILSRYDKEIKECPIYRIECSGRFERYSFVSSGNVRPDILRRIELEIVKHDSVGEDDHTVVGNIISCLQEGDTTNDFNLIYECCIVSPSSISHPGGNVFYTGLVDSVDELLRALRSRKQFTST